jgi:hypothetical protein
VIERGDVAAPADGIPAVAIERYDAIIATRPGIERKGASMPYTSIDGHMFSFLTPEGVLAPSPVAGRSGAVPVLSP